MAHNVGQLLDVLSAQLGVIERDEEVGGQYATLSSSGGCHEEVKVLVTVVMLDESVIDDASRGRINQLSRLILNKEALSDSLVHNNKGHLRISFCLVVEVLDDSLELRDLLVENLLSHGITNTISEYDEVLGELTIMIFSEQLNSISDTLLHFILDNLLTLFLNNVIRVVLGQLFIGCG